MTYLSASTALYGACALLFFALAVLVTVRGQVPRTGLYLAAASVLTGLWAGSIAVAGGMISQAGSILETLRTAAWALFIAHLLMGVMAERRRLPRLLVAGPIAGLTLAAIAVELAPWVGWVDPHLVQGDAVLKVLLCVAGVLMLENLYLNAIPESRWHINLLCIGVGAVFFYDIILYADALLLDRTSLVCRTNCRLSPDLFVARAPVDMFAGPLIALAAARNRRWMIDIHVSRAVLFHTSTLFISGVFLLSLSLAGYVLRGIGVAWGPVLDITLVFGGVLFVAVLFTSGRARSRLRAFIVHNFFTYRYDYRSVWLSFIDTLSNPSFSNEQLRVRVIRAVADTVDSPAGILWLSDGENTAFGPVAAWNVPIAGTPVDADFAAAFRDGGWIVDLGNPDPGVQIPPALARLPRAWLAVPLSHLGRMLGFILLSEPRAAIRLNWENYDLLRIVGRQVASYLSEEQAARALVEARQLQSYGQRFAFVVHDIKNLVSQLSLVLSNGERHADDPEFQRDVLETVRYSVGSMNKLLAQLRANRQAEAAEPVVPAALAAELVDAWLPSKPVRLSFRSDGGTELAKIGREPLESALRHLLDNAIEVSPEGADVSVEVRHTDGRIEIDIRDAGPGMPAAFVAEELFQPFRSTKSEGYGIGAYQTRELIRAAHGDLLVFSQLGQGTTMRVILPAMSEPVSSTTQKVLRVIS